MLGNKRPWGNKVALKAEFEACNDSPTTKTLRFIMTYTKKNSIYCGCHDKIPGSFNKISSVPIYTGYEIRFENCMSVFRSTKLFFALCGTEILYKLNKSFSRRSTQTPEQHEWPLLLKLFLKKTVVTKNNDKWSQLSLREEKNKKTCRSFYCKCLE